MSLPTDLSLMDYLFDREDPVLTLTDKDIIGRNDDKEGPEGICGESWPTNPDDFLDSILKLENHPFEILDDDDEMMGVPYVVPASSCSDSGISSDQQLSPLLAEVEEEDKGSSVSSGDTSPMALSHVYSDQECSVQEDLEIDSSVFNILDTSSLGEVKVEDNEAVISMNVLSSQQQTEKTSHSFHSSSRQTVTISPSRQLIRVTPMAGNPRSILLPLSLKEMKDIKTIKIINTSNPNVMRKHCTIGMHVTAGATKPVLVRSSLQDDVSKSSLSEETGDESDSQYPRLQLTAEEKRLLQKEGVKLPSHYPLTKLEERELKRIRRKIRNKISAQDSRKRKKEYIDGLEERVKQCTEENLHLVKRIKALQTQNQSLATQLKRLQSVLARGTAKTAQPATCLMVLLLSMALVMAPNLRLNQGTQSATDTNNEQDLSQPENKMAPLAGRSRNLLEFAKSRISEDGNIDQDSIKDDETKFLSDMADLLHFHNHVLGDHDYEPPPLKRSRIDEKTEDIKSSLLSAGKDYIVPPPDEIWPPPGPGDKILGNTVEKALGEEMKVNISDTNGTRTVVLQVPKEQ